MTLANELEKLAGEAKGAAVERITPAFILGKFVVAHADTILSALREREADKVNQAYLAGINTGSALQRDAIVTWLTNYEPGYASAIEAGEHMKGEGE